MILQPLNRVIKRFKFEIHWRITFLSVLFFPLLLSLGFWQIDRAQQKQNILDDWHKQQQLPPLDLNSMAWPIDFHSTVKRKIKAKGRFQEKKYWLLEAKLYRGKVGYHVVMPFIIDVVDTLDGNDTNTERVILINRGWVAGSAYREELPEFATPVQRIEVIGNLIKPTTSSFVDEVGGDRAIWPYRLLQIDIPMMSKQSGFQLAPLIIQIDPDNMAALAVSWPKINVTPAKHTGYAVQWFAMAGTLCLLWLFANSNLALILRSNVNK